MSNLKFSVLLSVYYKDNPIWLKEAIESVLNNTAKPSQFVLVIDGQIPTELEQIILQYQTQLDILRLEKNSGLGIALQKGLLQCKYPLVARMDSDDISLPNRFELQLKEFENNPQLSICGGYIQEIDSYTKENLSIRKVPLTQKEIYKYIKVRSPFNHPSVMFKKEDILKVGSYQQFYQMEDYYLWVKCISNNLQVKNISNVLLNFRIDKNMFARRGGYKYFKANKELAKEMLKLKIINYPTYLFNILVRFTTQIIMPNKIRSLFYKKVLR